jgi:hypothetical protein
MLYYLSPYYIAVKSNGAWKIAGNREGYNSIKEAEAFIEKLNKSYEFSIIKLEVLGSRENFIGEHEVDEVSKISVSAITDQEIDLPERIIISLLKEMDPIKLKRVKSHAD